MLKVVREYFRKIARADTLCVTIPKSSNCAVANADKLLSRYLENYKVLGENFSNEGLTRNISDSESIVLTDNLIIIAHPSKSLKGILTSKNTVITQDWFLSKDHKFNFLFAYVCNGFDILNSTSWNPIFRSWATFDKKIYYIKNHGDLEKRFVRFFKSLSKSLKNVDSTSEFKSTIRSEIDYSFLDVAKSYNEENGDQLLLLMYSNVAKNLKFKR